MQLKALHILYVDDDDNDLQLAKFAAAQAEMGSQLHRVNSGAKAIDYLKGRGAYADRTVYPEVKVLLLDLRMPQMNGLELLAWLREQPEFLGLVVIVFTSSAHPSDISRACELGCNAFVQKPSNHAELVRFLKLVNEFWGRFHEFPHPQNSALEQELPRPTLVP